MHPNFLRITEGNLHPLMKPVNDELQEEVNISPCIAREADWMLKNH